MSDPNFIPCDFPPYPAKDNSLDRAKSSSKAKRCGFTPLQEDAIRLMIQQAVEEAINKQPSNRKGKEEE